MEWRRFPPQWWLLAKSGLKKITDQIAKISWLNGLQSGWTAIDPAKILQRKNLPAKYNRRNDLAAAAAIARRWRSESWFGVIMERFVELAQGWNVTDRGCRMLSMHADHALYPNPAERPHRPKMRSQTHPELDWLGALLRFQLGLPPRLLFKEKDNVALA